MPALTEIFGDDACLQFGGGTLGHPWGNAVRLFIIIIKYCIKTLILFKFYCIFYF